MTLGRLLIANRGEIAIRVAEAAAAMGIESVAVFAEDDGGSLHRYRADRAVPLAGSGAGAYLDAAQLIEIARVQGCDAVHPGYGFLSENATFARSCVDAGLIFVGPSPDTLALFADKASARRLALEAGVAVIEGSAEAVSLEQAQAFFAALEPGATMIIKAIAGGGGRGMRVVRKSQEIAEAFTSASAEAEAAFGNGALFVERFVPAARHVEIQVVADANGMAAHLGERECSLQRRHQKLIEIAPCPGMTPVLRERISSAALTLARHAGYRNIGTFEFLVDAATLSQRPDDASFWFMEANPRIQVEHTVTEAVTGVDLVQTQLAIAAGATLAELGLDAEPCFSGHAIQARINLETMDAAGNARPAAGTIQCYELPSGPGVRVDGYGYAGFTASPRYDGLLAKLIVHAPGAFGAALAKAQRALSEARVLGVDTNIAFLRALLQRPELAEGDIDTRFVDRHLSALIEAAGALVPARLAPAGAAGVEQAPTLARAAAPGCVLVAAPMQGLVVEIAVEEGAAVAAGETLAVVEAMKMIHPIVAPAAGIVCRIGAALGAVVAEGDPMIEIELGADEGTSAATAEALDLEAIPPQLAELEQRRALGLDAARAEAVAKRHAIGHRTARENIADLTDPGSFVEYGALAIAAQSRRRSEDDLVRNTQADGIVTGTATVNAAHFGEQAG
ncbi:MAG: ATP-grasp domain-containing protein, partial [Beijerinckiaceae bacterium]|nr:ATP-grasp domain-containing protein [Beijerinckiaceae bacterium]